MTWTLLGLDHGRWEYVERSLAALDETIGLDFFDRRVFAYDGGHLPSQFPLAIRRHFDDLCFDGQRKGLAANIQRGWDVLGSDEWVFHLELDFVVHDAPLVPMAAVLQSHPSVAQMVLERQPLNASEVANGGLLGAENIPEFQQWGNPGSPWREQRHLFSFNPCVYHSSLASTAGTETDITHRLLAEGRTFGFWGSQGDAPRCEHIGVEGGMGSAGWRV